MTPCDAPREADPKKPVEAECKQGFGFFVGAFVIRIGVPLKGS